ncbi:MAG TPA: DUF4245 family protein [Nocardioides sp.]|uniref:DUF4245 family protein n=1 Tax=Nocardioides sp. TaxID=35761 RepID=UPI002C05633A|nr:DUF4245 family protein [Nocardioides sp.]HQR26124.1 DUF4245 family protein [Nocardioides sp.]
MSQPTPERPARYQRSTGGLIGALVITLVVITAFVLLRALNRTDLEVHPDPVDYRAAVVALQETGQRPVYPRALPAGWTATSVDVPRGDQRDWGIGMLTDTGGFVGVQQSVEPLGDLLETYVDQDTTEGDPIRVDGSVAGTWRSFSDSGGDRAYAAEVGDWTVLVYGSAPDADLREVVSGLTTDPA